MSQLVKPCLTALVLFTCVCLCSAGPQPASQDPRPADKPIPVLRVTTRMVLVDAVVTDGSGKPVSGLQAADFKVLENGKLQQIRGFSERSPELLRRQAPAAAPPSLPQGLFTNITDYHPEDGPLTIILIDSLNTPFFDQPYMRQGVIQYLQNIGPRQNIVIFTLGNHLGLIQNLNADPGLLREALKRIASDPLLKKQSPREPAAVDRDARARALAQDLLGVGAAYDKEHQIAELERSLADFFPDRAEVQVGDRVSATLEALKRISRSVAAYSGRKNLLWLSAGIPLSKDLLTSGVIGARSYEPEIRETTDLLADNQLAVYPVDVRGLLPNFLPDASSDIERHGTLAGPGAASVIGFRSAMLGASHQAMDYFAEETGGRAYYNRNDIDHGIETSVKDGSAYYSLGYYPDNKDWNGKFRKIEVKVLRKHLRVHYRRGYYAVDQTQHTAEQNKAAGQEFQDAMALDALPETALPVVAYVIPPDKDHKQLRVNIGVDPHAVIFLPQANERQEGQLQFATIVLDGNGNPVTSKANLLNAAMNPQTYAQIMKRSLVVGQTFDLSPGKYLLRVGVYDLNSHLMGTLTAKAEVPAPKVE